MTWQQITFRVAAGALERAEALLTLAGAAALTFDDAGDDPVFEPPPGETPLWPETTIHALFAADVELARLARLLETSGVVSGHVNVRALATRDWRTAGRSIRARAFGKRLWLQPADQKEPPPPGHGVVTINMGLAFGTGQHPTTALCLQWLDANIRPGITVIDYGCGSGVLAVAALALGASRAWAVDNDTQALTATIDNAKINGVEDRLWVGLPEDLPTVRADWVVANILADPLERLATTLGTAVVPGGGIVLSGILLAQRERIVAAYSPQFSGFVSAELDGWLRLEARLGNSAPAQ